MRTHLLQPTPCSLYTAIYVLALATGVFVNTSSGQGTEDFENLPTTSSNQYLSRSWTGTDGVTWTAEGARTDRKINDSTAICFGTSGDRWVTSPVYVGGMGTLTFDYVRDFTGTGNRSIEVYVNGNKIGDTITVSPTSDDVITYSETINIAGSIQLQIRSTGAAQVKLDNISWMGYTPDAPWLEAMPFSISGLDYPLTQGPSEAKSYELSGFNLEGIGNITVTAPEHFEIATSAEGSFHASLLLPFADGQITGQPITIYARLASGKTAATYSGNITHAGGGLDDPPTIELAGEVVDIILLTAGSYTETFDNLGSGLPPGVRVTTGATTDSNGTDATFSPTQNSWGDSGGAFKNLASAEGLTSSATTTQQNNSSNRALGIRTIATFGDPGAAFIVTIDNTRGHAGIDVSMDLMMLSVQGRSQTWTIDYRVGTSGDFKVLGTWPAPGEWGTTPFSAALGSDADNSHEPVEIRVVALSESTGDGSRDTIAIDNFELTATVIPRPTVIILQ